MLTGLKLYAAIGALALILGLAGWGYIEYQRVEIASAKVAQVTKERDDLRTSLVQAETEKAQLIQHQQETDAIVSAQRETERKLENEKAQIWTQFDKLIKSQPKEAQDCAASSVPIPVLEWLRDDGAGNGNEVPTSQDSPKSSSGLPADKPTT